MAKTAKTYVICKTKVLQSKRRLQYVNHRTNKTMPIVVGKRGGLSVKPPNSKSRRYVTKRCMKNSQNNKLFWVTVENMKKKRS